MNTFSKFLVMKPLYLVASLLFMLSCPLLSHAAEPDWATDLYWEGTIATSGTTSYTGRLYYTRLDGGGVTITGIGLG